MKILYCYWNVHLHLSYTIRKQIPFRCTPTHPSPSKLSICLGFEFFRGGYGDKNQLGQYNNI